MSRLPLQEGDYFAALVTRKDGTVYTAYFRVLHEFDSSMGHVVFVDDTGARVSMLPQYAKNMRPVGSKEVHPEINLEFWREKERDEAGA